MSKTTKVILVVLIVLIIDQCLKFWVKTNMSLNQDFPILGLEWARIHFVENPGMAFGWKLPEPFGKLLLSLFRIFAVSILIYFIRQLIHANAKIGLLLSFGLILAGAIGNIIDSAFYGLLFSGSYHQVATLFPEGGGYAGFLYGKVVDMLYFPMFEGHFPEWFPFWSGEPFLFFRPVFNIADASITFGVISIILFHRNFFGTNEKTQDKEEETVETIPPENTSDISPIDEAQKNNGDTL